MNKTIVTIGGTKEFTDFEFAKKEINKILKNRKLNKKDLLVYAYEDSYELTGAYKAVEDWAKSSKVTCLSGQIKDDKNVDWKIRKAERDATLSQKSDLLINLRVGNKNGGKSFIELFTANNVPVEVVDSNPAPTTQKTTEASTSSQKRKGEVPTTDTLARSIEIYSKVAQKLLNYGCLMVDTETTGLTDDDEVVEIALGDCQTEVIVFDSLIKTDKEINEYAFKVNQITPEMLKDAPTLEEVWHNLEAIIGNRILLASNSPFDERLLNQSLAKYGLTCSFIWMDIQTIYRAYSCQKDASKFPLRTEGMCRQLGITPGTHRAKNDVLAQIKILKAMADKVVPNFDA